MSRKEIEFNGIFYWELEQKDFFQLFPECPKALMFENESGIDFIGTEIVLCLGKKDCLTKNPFISKDGRCFSHAVLLSSRHEKKSRRCTNRELMKWCLGFGGFWVDESKHVRLDIPNCRMDHLTDSIPGFVVSICTWDGEPMEPTAKNMGLPE